MNRSGVYFGIMTMVLLSTCGPARRTDSSDVDNCLAAIVPCGEFLNSTRPSSKCCSPLEKVYNTDKVCLCNLLNQTNLLKQFRVNITQAIQLPIHCGINASTSGCSNLGGNSTTSGSPPPPSTNTSSTSSEKRAASSPSFEILPLLVLLLLAAASQV